MLLQRNASLQPIYVKLITSLFMFYAKNITILQRSSVCHISSFRNAGNDPIFT